MFCPRRYLANALRGWKPFALRRPAVGHRPRIAKQTKQLLTAGYRSTYNNPQGRIHRLGQTTFWLNLAKNRKPQNPAPTNCTDFWPIKINQAQNPIRAFVPHPKRPFAHLINLSVLADLSRLMGTLAGQFNIQESQQSLLVFKTALPDNTRAALFLLRIAKTHAWRVVWEVIPEGQRPHNLDDFATPVLKILLHPVSPRRGMMPPFTHRKKTARWRRRRKTPRRRPLAPKKISRGRLSQAFIEGIGLCQGATKPLDPREYPLKKGPRRAWGIRHPKGGGADGSSGF